MSSVDGSVGNWSAVSLNDLGIPCRQSSVDRVAEGGGRMVDARMIETWWKGTSSDGEPLWRRDFIIVRGE